MRQQKLFLIQIQDYAGIIENIDQILQLPVNLIEAYYLQSLKGYCAYRSKQNDLGNEIILELENYEVLKKTIGGMTYDCMFALIKGAALLNAPESYNRGYQKISMILTKTTADTILVLSTIAFDFVKLPNP
ncbi:hypothetical protein FPZ43_00005 [Mucilaginibacter pallidiroseus]|uniref:Uncharacterized protein n=1 Tax=Mucilaginibacter pallidiroseus TaxID=2599295 RepID=A0A563UHN7_9SPHI|nr:hypothetical protein [Mucilaginibacter pallidiroseus]TWR30902.1 hypothetical protein FPZ43_00005 [Mucilaginibacter pallidiroseus]